MLRRNGRAVIGREIEEEGVVLGHHRSVRSEHAAAPQCRDDSGCNVTVRRELRVVGGHPRRKRSVEIQRGDHLRNLDATSGMGPRVLGCGTRHAAWWRRAGEAPGQRADRLRGA